ncbi:MAG: Mur ligase family protein [Sulfurospirillaceae bacterium]|nr:Mur ligase family protein [Sulfurospirillaceae bacterium]
MRLIPFLEQKPLYYDVIDYSRMPKAYECIKQYIKLPKIIHVVGTNGKGSTGRFLANILLNKGISVGHYTSPHIFKFNERIWVNGKNIDDKTLEDAHIKLQKILPENFIETLSYFEYTTFLAMLVFSDECEYVVLEAGLGGEHDATNVFPKILSIVTPIGYDHQSFLGNSIEEIATTKLNSITKEAVISRQYEEIVYDYAKKIATEKSAKLYFVENILLEYESEMIATYVKDNNLPGFQKINLQTAYCAAKILGFDDNIDIANLGMMEGRCQKVAKNVTIDVGHNKMAALAMVKYFNNKKVNLVYNSFKDKEFKDILHILFPIVKRVELLYMENPRKMATEEIIKICKDANVDITDFKNIKDDEEYLVFGSFVVVEKFMKGLRER